MSLKDLKSTRFYITTPIYYVNDKPHIGHAYTTIACDAMARHMRLLGKDTYFLTGTDEHGQKIEQAAKAKGLTPQELVDQVHVKFKDMCRVLNISNDDFIRTTEKRHICAVQRVFKQLLAQEDIYKGEYEGYYCVPCESYVPENAMGPDKTCPDCGRPLTLMKEECYFFKGSNYVPELIDFYERNGFMILPRVRYNEVMSFLRGGVKDIAVSRTSIKWGIPVPGDEKHVIYVWLDALVNYISALGYPNDVSVDRYWPYAHHVVGKDIIRFHCVIWPLMLLALGLPLPEIIAHGWWKVNDQKMSKSLGNTVDPFELVKRYGVDPLRYFLLREVPFGNDGSFSEQALVERINSDLANDLGNLLNRTLKMIDTYCGGVVPLSYPPLHSDLAIGHNDMRIKSEDAMVEYLYNEALEAIWDYVKRCNKYIDETEPWNMAKDPEEREELELVLTELYEALSYIALSLSPFMPETAAKMWHQLGQKGTPDYDKYDHYLWGDGMGKIISSEREILFPRIDLAKWKAELDKPAEPEPEYIGIDDFGKVEMRVAEILECSEIPKSKKLYKLTVDLGTEKRTVCSGIKAFFTPDELVGRRVILVCNLKPVKLCGVESNGMILCASVKNNGNTEQLTLIAPEKDIPLGSRVS